MTLFSSLLLAVYFFYWAQPISTDGYGLENDTRGKGTKKQEPFLPFYPSSPLHTVFHQTILHLYMTVLLIGVSALFWFLSLPSCCFLPLFWSQVSLTLSCLCTSCIIEGHSRQEWKRKKERGRRERGNPCETETHVAKPSEWSYGRNVQCTGGECVQAD